MLTNIMEYNITSNALNIPGICTERDVNKPGGFSRSDFAYVKLKYTDENISLSTYLPTIDRSM